MMFAAFILLLAFTQISGQVVKPVVKNVTTQVPGHVVKPVVKNVTSHVSGHVVKPVFKDYGLEYADTSTLNCVQGTKEVGQAPKYNKGHCGIKSQASCLVIVERKSGAQTINYGCDDRYLCIIGDIKDRSCIDTKFKEVPTKVCCCKNCEYADAWNPILKFGGLPMADKMVFILAAVLAAYLFPRM